MIPSPIAGAGDMTINCFFPLIRILPWMATRAPLPEAAQSETLASPKSSTKQTVPAQVVKEKTGLTTGVAQPVFLATTFQWYVVASCSGGRARLVVVTSLPTSVTGTAPVSR